MSLCHPVHNYVCTLSLIMSLLFRGRLCCSVLQRGASAVQYRLGANECPFANSVSKATDCNRLQYNATHCNALQHAPVTYACLQHNATHCNTLQHTTTPCNTLLDTTTHYCMIFLPLFECKCLCMCVCVCVCVRVRVRACVCVFFFPPSCKRGHSPPLCKCAIFFKTVTKRGNGVHVDL